MKFFYIFAAMLLGTGQLMNAQTHFIPINADYAVFNGSDGKEYVEVYISFRQNALRYVLEDSGYVANFSALLEVSQNETTLLRREQPFISHIDSLEAVYVGNEFRHVFALQLTPGNYETKITLRDANAARQGEFFLTMNVGELSNSEPVMSDIEFAANISRAAGESKFNKNGLQVVPNPSGMYHVSMPMLYYYAEVHNLPYSPEAPGNYTLESYITDKNGAVVKRFPDKTNPKPGTSTVLIGGSNVVTLNSDVHFLNLRFTDNQTGQTLEKRKRFTLYKPSQEDVDQISSMTSRLMTAYYAKFSEKELDEEFDKARYLASKEEKEIYKNLGNITGKAEFLSDFWRRRDRDPATPQNEYKADYFQLVEFADTHFTNKIKPGWKSDRGRILLTYGRPSEIERSPMETSKKPHEIWVYNELEGGSMFVFCDMKGFGEFELLHSTYRKELSQPDWERLIEVQDDALRRPDFSTTPPN